VHFTDTTVSELFFGNCESPNKSIGISKITSGDGWQKEKYIALADYAVKNPVCLAIPKRKGQGLKELTIN